MKEFELKELNENNWEELKLDLNKFINHYYQNIKLNFDKPIMLINLSTLLIMIKWNVDLDQFEKQLEQDNNFKKIIYRFLKDNLLHYSATIKFKEQVEIYQRYLDKVDGDVQVQFINDYDPSIYLNQINNHTISANTGLNSDVDQQTQDLIFKDVKVY